MDGIGHFPMAENPALFLQHVRPILEEIAAAADGRGAGSVAAGAGAAGTGAGPQQQRGRL
eukprot:COSAG06_NODE_6373_length_2959_cov_3.413986_5_plen_60_part_00